MSDRISGDFGEISFQLDEIVMVNANSIGLKRLSQICEPFRSERFKSLFWVGCRHDGEDESPDVERLNLFRRAFADLQAEFPRTERRMQDFYYGMQIPSFDADADEGVRRLSQSTSDEVV